jgi:hypothetical protein
MMECFELYFLCGLFYDADYLHHTAPAGRTNDQLVTLGEEKGEISDIIFAVSHAAT